MAEHWNDSAHRLGLFDEHGRPRPQYFVYSMLYAMAENEAAAAVGGCENIKIIASGSDSQNTIFITNYNPQAAQDLTMSIKFKNAKVGIANMSVCRIDEDMMWDDDTLELIPAENRTVYLHEDFHFDVYIPAYSVVMITFDYDVKKREDGLGWRKWREWKIRQKLIKSNRLACFWFS
jgi:hypothetical protein